MFIAHEGIKVHCLHSNSVKCLKMVTTHWLSHTESRKSCRPLFLHAEVHMCESVCTGW